MPDESREQGSEGRPYRCGCFVSATGELCTLESDHDGAHRFASDAPTPPPPSVVAFGELLSAYGDACERETVCGHVAFIDGNARAERERLYGELVAAYAEMVKENGERKAERELWARKIRRAFNAICTDPKYADPKRTWKQAHDALSPIAIQIAAESDAAMSQESPR